MKTKLLSIITLLFFATSAMALNPLVYTEADYASESKIKKLTSGDAYIQLSAESSITEAIYDLSAKNLFFVTLLSSTGAPDANYTIVNGLNAHRTNANTGLDEIVTFIAPSTGDGLNSTLTFKQGTYNFSIENQAMLVFTARGKADGLNGNRAIIFDSDSTTNIFSSSAKMQGLQSAKIVSRGTMNIYNTAYTTAVPSDVKYGQLYTVGTFIQESGTITANDLLVESNNARFNGTLNLKQAVASGTHISIDIKDAKSLTLGADAKVTTTTGSRIRLGLNSSLTVEAGEKAIKVDTVFIHGSNVKLNLAGKNSFAHSNGKFETTLLTYTGKENLQITVSETNTFGATYIAASNGWKQTNEAIKIYIDFDFTSDDQYLSLGRMYTGSSNTGIDPVFYLKDFQNGYLRAKSIDKTGVAALGDTKLYIFNEASQTYEFVESMWVGDATNGYILTIAVPEPAEWAMIFGAIALGFAIYRRRK